MLFSVIMLCLCAFFIVFLLIWNRKSVKYHQQINKFEAKQQKEMLQAMIQGQELERKRISENFHDDIGPLLASLKLQSKRIAMDSDLAHDFYETVANTVQSLRKVSKELSPVVLDELGLFHAIEYYAQNFNEYGKVYISLDWDRNIEASVSQEIALNIFRIVQEGLTNIIRHSNANTAQVQGKLYDHKIEIVITDNGIGMKKEDENKNIGLGIKNIKARAKSMDANINFDTSEKGTCITLIIERKKDD